MNTIKFYLGSTLIKKYRAFSEEGRKNKIKVMEGCMFNLADSLIQPSEHTVILLNFACNYVPGGPSNLKCNTQEEILMRDECPELYRHLKEKQPDFYPIDDENGCALLLTEKVPFRGKEFTVMSCAAISLPPTVMSPEGYKVFKNEDDSEETFMKMVGMLHEAKQYFGKTPEKIPHLILGGWGCGVFYNPPVEMVELWKFALERVQIGSKHDGNIYFPIYSQQRGAAAKTKEIDSLYSIFKRLDNNS